MAETETRPPFRGQLQRQWNQGKFLCVGLDADIDKLPRGFKGGFPPAEVMRDPSEGFYARQVIWDKFLIPIIEATSDIVGAYKPNIAFYEGNEQKHWALESTLQDLDSKHPEIPVILDAKRADIGNTNKYYDEMFDRYYGVDAMTTNPYFGNDTFPALNANHKDRGLIVLCKTTNPGAALYQDAPIDIVRYQELQALTKGSELSVEEYEKAWEAAGEYFKEMREIAGNKDSDLVGPPTFLPLYRLIALRTASLAADNPNIGLVVGATHPEAFAPVRRIAGDMPFLIPGIGTQGGDLEKTLKYAPDSNHQGIIINSGSSIIHASQGEDFAEAARNAALKLDRQIREGLQIV